MPKLATRLKHKLSLSDKEFNLIGHALRHYAMSPVTDDHDMKLRGIKEREAAMNLSTEMYVQRAKYAELLEERLNDEFGIRGLKFCTCMSPAIIGGVCTSCGKPGRENR